MDKALASILYDQLAQGNREDGYWKEVAYQAAMEYINAHFAIITNIKNQSGLVWDEAKKKVVVIADNHHVWDAYVKVGSLMTFFSEIHSSHILTKI